MGLCRCATSSDHQQGQVTIPKGVASSKFGLGQGQPCAFPR